MGWLGNLLGWEHSSLSVAEPERQATWLTRLLGCRLSVAERGAAWKRWHLCDHSDIARKLPDVGICKSCFQPMRLQYDGWRAMDWRTGYRKIKTETWLAGLFSRGGNEEHVLKARLAFLAGAIEHGQSWFRWNGRPPANPEQRNAP